MIAHVVPGLPDLVVGAGIVAASVAGAGYAWLANRWTLARQQRAANYATVADGIDDLIKIAQAVGVYQPPPLNHEGCDDCKAIDGICSGCLADLREQGVLSLYSPATGWWNR